MKRKILLCVIIAAIGIGGAFSYKTVREYTKNQIEAQQASGNKEDGKEDLQKELLKGIAASMQESAGEKRAETKLPARKPLKSAGVSEEEEKAGFPVQENSGGGKDQSVIAGQVGEVALGNGSSIIPDDLPAKSLEEDKDNANDPDSNKLNGKTDDTSKDNFNETDNPDEKDDSNETNNPDEKDDSNETNNPDEEDDSNETNNPDDNDNSDGVNAPDDSDDTDGEDDSEETDNPDEGKSKYEEGKPYLTLVRGENEKNPATGMFYKYNANQKGFVTPVKNQGGYNTCWSFAAVSAAESALLAQSKPLPGTLNSAETLDLSELQLSYFFYHNVPDKLGNTAGDTTTALGMNYLARGGNEIFATFAMANRTGLVAEADLPYESAADDSQLAEGSYLYDTSLAWSRNLFHLENAYWIAYADTNVMKQAIIDYGAASFQFYSTKSGSYYNSATYGYYCPEQRAVNHAGVIVGWDDDYSRKNFLIDPGRDGAWLVKNSYGTGFGEDGYIWVSYADACFLSTTYKAYVFDTVPADGSTLYQYDGSSGYLYAGILSGSRIANVFTAAAPGEEQKTERLEAVSFALYDTYVNYDIQVYKLSEESMEDGVVKNPEAGEPCISEENKVSGQTKTTGYYTVHLKEPIILQPGELFAVVVTLSKNDGSSVEVFVDGSYTNGNWIRFTNSVEPGQSFIKEGSEWDDLYNDRASASSTQDGLTVRLKAITVPQ